MDDVHLEQHCDETAGTKTCFCFLLSKDKLFSVSFLGETCLSYNTLVEVKQHRHYQFPTPFPLYLPSQLYPRRGFHL